MVSAVAALHELDVERVGTGRKGVVVPAPVAILVDGAEAAEYAAQPTPLIGSNPCRIGSARPVSGLIRMTLARAQVVE